MNNSATIIRSAIEECLLEYVRRKQAEGEIAPDISERELSLYLRPTADRLMKRVADRPDYYLPMIIRGEFEDHVREVINSLPWSPPAFRE